MNTYQVKPTEKMPVAKDVMAGQWNRLGDMPSVGIVGDGGETRGILIGEAEQIVLRVYTGDWVVETSPEVFEKFTNAEFNEHFRAIIRDTLHIKTGVK